MKKLKIVVLDGYTANPGDLSWGEMAALGDFTVYERTAPEDTVARIGDAQVVLTNKTAISKKVIAAAPELKYIGVLATGYNVVDVQAAAAKGIVVTNIPGYSTAAVAQAVFAHLLNIANRVELHANSVRNGDWSKAVDFCYWKSPQLELAGKVLGIVGFGSIGRRVAGIGAAFGMRVKCCTRTVPQEDCGAVEFCSFDELVAEADVVTLHCPLTAQTEGLIDGVAMAKMKDGVILINTGRGQLLDEAAVAAALKSGKIAAAGLDVLAQEPPEPGNPLLKCENCFITPHIAWASREARLRLLNIAADNIKKFLDGSPQNVVC